MTSIKSQREIHKDTYNSWKNMKQRAKHNDMKIHEDFEAFQSFLNLMGPRPTKEHTLDRINNDLKEYSPENCRWANKIEQSANRSNTITLTYSGTTKPLTEWARETHQKANTLRGRYNKGWPHDEVINGRNLNKPHKAISTSNIPELSASEIKMYKSISAHNCHHSQKWPWISESNAEGWEFTYIDERVYPETRYQFFKRKALLNLENLRIKIDEHTNIAEWKTNQDDYTAEQNEDTRDWIRERGIALKNIEEKIKHMRRKERNIEKALIRMKPYKLVQGPFHHQGYAPKKY